MPGKRKKRLRQSSAPPTQESECRTPWLERRKRYYLVECAWCKKRMRWKRAEGPVPYKVSHSICAAMFCVGVSRVMKAPSP